MPGLTVIIVVGSQTGDYCEALADDSNTPFMHALECTYTVIVTYKHSYAQVFMNLIPVVFMKRCIAMASTR